MQFGHQTQPESLSVGPFWSCGFLVLGFKTWITLSTAPSLCFRYDEELGLVYMAARLAGGYAAVRRAINEVMNKR